MVGGHDQRQRVFAVGVNLDVAVGRVAGKDADVRGVLGHRLDDGGRDLLFQVHLHVGVVVQEQLDVLRQELRDGGNVGVDADEAAQAARVVAHLHGDLVQLVQGAARHGGQRDAGRGGADALVGADQQPDLQVLFQLADAFADGGRGDVFVFGRRRDGALFDHADEKLEGSGV
ncbi:hypothetical protein D3C72_1789260 [compost metagenome]